MEQCSFIPFLLDRKLNVVEWWGCLLSQGLLNLWIATFLIRSGTSFLSCGWYYGDKVGNAVDFSCKASPHLLPLQT